MFLSRLTTLLKFLADAALYSFCARDDKEDWSGPPPCVVTLEVLSLIILGNPFFFRAFCVSLPKSPSAPYLGKMLLPYLLIRACCNCRTLSPLLPFFNGKPSPVPEDVLLVLLLLVPV